MKACSVPLYSKVFTLPVCRLPRGHEGLHEGIDDLGGRFPPILVRWPYTDARSAEREYLPLSHA